MCFQNRPDHEQGSACRGATRGDAGLQFFSREPSLDEILADPLIRLLMTSDKVDDSALRRLVMQSDGRALASSEVAP